MVSQPRDKKSNSKKALPPSLDRTSNLHTCFTKFAGIIPNPIHIPLNLRQTSSSSLRSRSVIARSLFNCDTASSASVRRAFNSLPLEDKLSLSCNNWLQVQRAVTFVMQ